jgi:hypothetical protein
MKFLETSPALLVVEGHIWDSTEPSNIRRVSGKRKTAAIG